MHHARIFIPAQASHSNERRNAKCGHKHFFLAHDKRLFHAPHCSLRLDLSRFHNTQVFVYLNTLESRSPRICPVGLGLVWDNSIIAIKHLMTIWLVIMPLGLENGNRRAETESLESNAIILLQFLFTPPPPSSSPISFKSLSRDKTVAAIKMKWKSMEFRAMFIAFKDINYLIKSLT